ncbi:hypothetical protein BXZ70DRAFT_17235 [Cristinia sonorae]|uniref:Serum paraoxonase/arylesterase n=1 Tax=Cristinia sonorae TaxID=1940300 RepID=A0A8K0UXV7_9AGAR|nr:hypothetical protein BXZ70DRAFT_17235 [Cristinia sonorae]
MPSSLSVVLILLVAGLGSFYQLVVGPVIHAGGVFRKVYPLNNQNCRTVPELDGCEKIVHVPESGLLYLACSRISQRPYWLPAITHLNASGIPLDDHVATYDITTGKVTRLQVEDYPNASRGLYVHGMDVVPAASDPSLLYVYMVNHRVPLEGDPAVVGADSSIEIFSTKTGSSKLKHVATIDDPVIVTPNDVVGYPDGKSFYFTNDHAVKTGFYRQLELIFNLTSTSVGYCHTHDGCKIAADNLQGANGIAKSPTNDTIYVGSAHGAGIYVMDPQTDHTLILSDRISAGGIPMDNLSFDKNGALWAPLFPRGFEAVSRYKDFSIKAASSAWQFTTNIGPNSFYGEKYKAERVFEDDGGVIMGATTAVYLPDSRELFIHGISSPHLTICKV